MHMFSGTGGLPDYSMPEDASFRGAQLLSTPSPNGGWPSLSPVSSAAGEDTLGASSKREAANDAPVVQEPPAKRPALGSSAAGRDVELPAGEDPPPTLLPTTQPPAEDASGASSGPDSVPPLDGLPELRILKPEVGCNNKTFAGRYQPKTESGSAAWLARKHLFFTLVPPEFQNSKLQLSFWKFCTQQVEAGSSEVEAAREFVRLGQLGSTSPS